MVSVFLVEALHSRHLLATRDAPAGPEIEHKKLPTKILKADLSSFKIRKRKARGRGGILYLLQIGNELVIDPFTA
jgi:hypothetical protein